MSSKYLIELHNIKELLWAPKPVRKFNKKNRNITIFLKTFSRRQKPIFLIESQQAYSNQLAIHYFSRVFTRLFQTKNIAYTMMKPKPHSRISELIRTRNSMYRSFGCRTHLVISGFGNDSWEEKYSREILTPENLEAFCIDQIRIGDLIYDTFLRRTKKATIDLQSKEFREIFNECVNYFENFKKIFDKYEVKAVSVSHCVYHFAIPLRIAIAKGIDAYQITGEAIYKMDEINSHAYTSFKYYKKELNKVNNIYKSSRIEIEKDLTERFSGKVSKYMPYSTKSAFEKSSESLSRVIKESEKTKILVAIHDFFDSPHSYGDNFYPDFYLWMRKLGQVSLETDYDWYIKTHRDPIGDASQILKNFSSEFSKFTVLDKDVDHHTLITQGIDIALTVYGSIAMEYPYFGVPVINASINNPHVNFGFSLTPKSRSHYEETLMNLSGLDVQIDKEEIYQYYFMANLNPLRSVIFRNYDEFVSYVGGYSNAIGIDSVSFWLKKPEARIPEEQLDDAIQEFILSKDFRLSKNHFHLDGDYSFK